MTAINHQNFLILGDGTHQVAVKLNLGSQSEEGKCIGISVSLYLLQESFCGAAFFGAQ